MSRLFVASVVVVIEELWFNEIGDTPSKSSKTYAVTSQLFQANNAEAAFAKVQSWLADEGFSDSNHDGPGDLTRVSAVGINQLTEVAELVSFNDRVNDIYGIEVSNILISEMDVDGKPRVRAREELEVFRLTGE